jgi:hypothetical protein
LRAVKNRFLGGKDTKLTASKSSIPEWGIQNRESRIKNPESLTWHPESFFKFVYIVCIWKLTEKYCSSLCRHSWHWYYLKNGMAGIKEKIP